MGNIAVRLCGTFFPGEPAAVDHHQAEIHEAFGAPRGIFVDKSEYHIEFLYRPASALGILYGNWTRWHTGKHAVE